VSARRHYTIECDGPNCLGFIDTDKPFVGEARAEAAAEDWHKVGASVSGALDFCAPSCEREYLEANPPRHARWPFEHRAVDS